MDTGLCYRDILFWVGRYCCRKEDAQWTRTARYCGQPDLGSTRYQAGNEAKLSTERDRGRHNSTIIELERNAYIVLQGRVRLLQYAEESKRLYFTTSLQNAVQTYSIDSAKLLDPLHTHPSPPKVFALSANMELLLSASANPSTIYITNTTLTTTPILLQPQCSSSTAVAAAFHPHRPSLFVLGFADGTLAVYDARYFLLNDGMGERKDRPEEPTRNGEIAFKRKLHAPVTAVSGKHEEWIPPFRGYDSGTKKVIVGDVGIGISAVAFIPGFDCATVSVGADGKCCVVDFTTATPAIRSWHVMSAATCLSIIRPQSLVSNKSDKMTRNKKRGTSGDGYLAAVGCKDGRVLLYDLKGNLLGQHNMDVEARVVDVDWIELTSSPYKAYKRPPQTVPPKPFSSSARRGATTSSSSRPDSPKICTANDTTVSNLAPNSPKSPGHSFASLRLAIYNARALADTLDAEMETSMAQGQDEVAPSPGFDGAERSGELLEKEKNGSDGPYLDPQKVVTYRHKTVPLVETVESTNPPKIPPRPTPRVGGKLAMRQIELSHTPSNAQGAKSTIQACTKSTGNGPGNRSLMASTTDARRFMSGDVADSKTPASNPQSGTQSMKPPALSKRGPKSKQRSSRREGLEQLPAQSKGPPQKYSISGRTINSNSRTMEWSAVSPAELSLHHSSSRTQGVGFPVPAPTQPTTDVQSLASNDTIINWRPAASLDSSINVLEDVTAGPEQVTSSPQASGEKPSSRPVLERTSMNPRLRPSSPQLKMSNFAKESKAPTLCTCEHGQGRLVEELTRLEKALKEEIGTLRNDMTQAITLQRDWFVDLMDKGNEWGRRVEGENRLLREEMARERRARA